MAYPSSLLSLFSVIFFSSFVYSRSCDPSLISIPIRNVSLESPSVRRGAAVSIGTPPQNMAFHIDLDYNNTFIYDESGACDPGNPPIQCQAFNGGAFNPGASSTWVPNAGFLAPEAAGVNVSTDGYGTDTIQLGPSVSIPAFPIYIPDAHVPDWEENSLGFGMQSTILDSLINAGVIASRTFSIFFGLTGASQEDQMDGSLVIGGYDAAKIVGQNHTYPLKYTTACPTGLGTVVTDISMNFENGTSQSITGPAQGFALEMCINPAYPLITIPYAVWESFQSHAPGTYIGRSYGINLFGELYAAEDAYTGDLTFSFQDGLQIRIPNHQLVLPDIAIDESGNTIYNYSVREVMLNSDQQVNANDMPLLGGTFLSSAYLSVNQGYGSFSLWQANVTTHEQLISFAPTENGCEGTANTTTTSSSSSSSSSSTASTASSTSATASQSPKLDLSSGGIAGAVVSAMVLIGLIAGGIFMWRRKGNRQRRIEAMNQAYDMGRPSDRLQGQSTKRYDKPELYGDQYKGNYSDRNWGRMASEPSRVEPTQHHIGDAFPVPQELDAT